MTAEQIKADPRLSPMADNDVVLVTNGEGIVFDFFYLDALKARWDVDEADPEAALAKIKELKGIVPLTNDERDEVLTGLVIDQANGEETNDLTVDCIMELYDKIDELEGRLQNG